jgi:hypothetical protein
LTPFGAGERVGFGFGTSFVVLLRRISALMQWHHVRTIGESLVRVGVHFHEKSVYAGTGRGTGQRLDELALTAGFGASPAWQLHTVSGIEYDGIPEATHNGKGPHIDDEIVVPEGRPAFGEHNALTPALFHLFHGIGHFRRRKELPLLDVHYFAGLGCGDQQIGLPAKERGDLQDIDNLARFRRLLVRMDIGEHGKAQLILDLLQNRQPLLDAGATIGLDRRPVRFVE